MKSIMFSNNILRPSFFIFSPIYRIRRHVDDGSVATLEDPGDKPVDLRRHMLKGLFIVTRLSDPVVWALGVYGGYWGCWWTNCDVEPQMTGRKLLKESIDGISRAHLIIGLNSITPKLD